MDLVNPISINDDSELYYNFNPVDCEQFKSNRLPVTPMRLTSINNDQQLSTNDNNLVTIKSSNAHYMDLDGFEVPSWLNFNYDQNGCQSNQLSPISASNSYDQQSISSSPPTTLSHPLNIHHQVSSSSSSLETESSSSSSSLSSSGDVSITMKDNQSTGETKLLQLFESTIFNQLVEENFIKISLLDETLSCKSGLRQLEMNKFHELAQLVDLLNNQHKNLTTINPDNPEQLTARYQIEIVHRHTEKLITIVKKVKSFTSLCLDDQILLLKSRFIDLCIIKSLIFIEPETRTIKINGQQISMEKCHMMNSEQFIKFTTTINPIVRKDPIINLLILLICLLNPSIKTNLRSTFEVRKEYILTIHLVQKYLELRGFTINQANCEIKTLINNLDEFLLIFDGKQKIQQIAKKHLGYTSQLIAEMLDING